MFKKWAIEIICYLLIFLFSYTGISKLLDFNTFKTQLSQSPITTNYATLITFLLPGIEILLSIMLIVSRTRLTALYGSLFLMSSFSFYIYMMLNYSFYIPCSCGGIISKMSWPEHLLFNIVFVVLCIIGIILQADLITNSNKTAVIGTREIDRVIKPA